MKKILIVTILFFSTICFAQDIKTDYDKFTKVKKISLEDNIKLKTDDNDKNTERFFLNIYKIMDNADTLFYLHVHINSYYNSYCGEGMKAILLLNDTSTINLSSITGDWEAKSGNYLAAYYLNYRLSKSDLTRLYNSNKIEIKCYVTELSFQGIFTKENKKEFNNYLKKYLLVNIAK